MSIIRGVAKSFLGLLFTLALMGTITVYSMISFTSYDNVKSIVGDLVRDNMPVADGSSPTQDEQRVLENMKAACQGKDSISGFGPQDLIIRCSDIDKLSSGGSVNEFLSSSFVNSAYYKSYDCDFVTCVRSGTPLFPLVISETANKFYSSIMNYALILTIVLGALFVAAAQGVNGRLKSMGFSLVWASAPFLFVSFFIGGIVGQFTPAELTSSVQPIVSSVFSPSIMIYSYLLIAGIVLAAAGILVKPENYRFSKKNKK